MLVEGNGENNKEQVRQGDNALLVIYNSYLEILTYDVSTHPPHKGQLDRCLLCGYHDLRILTYIRATILKRDELKPELTKFEVGELETFHDEVKPKLPNLVSFRLTTFFFPARFSGLRGLSNLQPF